MHRKLKFSIELKRENVIYFVITLLLFFSVIQASLLGYVNASAVSLIYSLSIVLRSVLAALWFVSKPTFRKKELRRINYIISFNSHFISEYWLIDTI